MTSTIEKAISYYTYGLVLFLVTDNPKFTSEEQIVGNFSREHPVSSEAYIRHFLMTKLAIERAKNNGWFATVDDPFAPSWIKLLPDGEKKALSDADVKAVKLKYDALGSENFAWLTAAFQSISDGATIVGLNAAIEAEKNKRPSNATESKLALSGHDAAESFDSEDTWKPLAIDRSTSSYKEAVEAAEEALTIVEGNNGYAQTEPDERNAIVESIKGTIKSIKEGTPSLASIKSSLVAPLIFLSTKFSDAAIGVAAKHAMEKLFSWIAGLF